MNEYIEVVFANVLKASLAASFVIAAVLVFRLLLKKCPKRFSYVLWALVLIRLLVPSGIIPVQLSISQPVNTIVDRVESMQPFTVVTDTYTEGTESYDNAVRSGYTPYEKEGVLAVDETKNLSSVLISLACLAWLCGVAAFALYGIISCLRLKKRVQLAVKEQDNIYNCDNIPTAFVFGFFRPKIYLPDDVGSDHDYVVAHEKTHIRRFDFLVKPIAFAVLAVHWFNPLMWFAYYLMNKDMELSCDEAAIKRLGGKNAEYSQALLNMAREKTHFISVPLAFGEGNAKSRIKNALNLKKPAAWIVIVALVAVAVAVIIAVTGAGTMPTNVSDEIEKAVVDLIFDTEIDKNRPAACYGEGHVVFGCEESDSKLTVYGTMRFSAYNYMNGNLSAYNGYGMSAPFVATFAVKDGAYTDGKMQYPKDGSEYAPSIKEMFPKQYEKQALSTEYSEKIKEQENAYAEKFLAEQNNGAELITGADLLLLTDRGVSVAASNSLPGAYNAECPWVSYCPMWLGTEMLPQNGKWIVYSTAYDEATQKVYYSCYENGSTQTDSAVYQIDGDSVKYVGTETVPVQEFFSQKIEGESRVFTTMAF